MSKIINSTIQVSAENDKNSIIIPINGIIMRKELQTQQLLLNQFFLIFDLLSFTSQYVTNIIPNIGKEEMKTYGKTANKVEGSKIFILI
jgi:hypothetical protein